MTKLYYSAGACSMSCEIAFEEMGIPHEAILINWDNQNAALTELQRLNPLGAAPVAVTENGKALTQNTAIMEYFADKHQKTKMLPAPGTFERAQVLQWLSFAATDFHKSFTSLFALEMMTTDKAAQAEVRAFTVKQVETNLAYLDQALAGKDYVTGSEFTVADCYLFVVTNWTQHHKIPLDAYPNLSAYQARVYQRPSVQKTLKAAGLLK